MTLGPTATVLLATLENAARHVSWRDYKCTSIGTYITANEDAGCNVQLDQFIKDHGSLTDS